jgi:hypothetical protein
MSVKRLFLGGGGVGDRGFAAPAGLRRVGSQLDDVGRRCI